MLGDRTLRANTYWRPYFPWVCFCLNFLEEQVGWDCPLAKRILSYFEWQDMEGMQLLNKMVEHEKRKYYRLHWQSLKQKVFAKDQALATPRFKSLLDVRFHLSDFNIPWEPIVQPTFRVPRTLLSTVHPIQQYMLFNVS